MSHSYSKIWIHAIWATKDRKALISPSIEEKLHQFMVRELEEMGCQVEIINGMPDHVHCLFRLNVQRSISEVIKQVKGSSSHYINQSDLTPQKFAWQTGYAAFSVSESGVEKVIQYIQNQKTHHRKKSFQEEYEEFISVYGLQDRNG